VTIVGFVPAEACRREASGLLTGNLVGHPARLLGATVGVRPL